MTLTARLASVAEHPEKPPFRRRGDQL